jgi:primosomal protein N' (replication factor Y) (superfamily II helicase)
MQQQSLILRVAINAPVRKLFDYLPPPDINTRVLVPGIRLRIPFGKSREKVGLLVDIRNKSEIAAHRLKRVIDVLDSKPVIDQELFRVFQWAINYYHHPAGEVWLGCLPKLLGKGAPAVGKEMIFWRLSHTIKKPLLIKFENAPRQKSIFKLIASNPEGISQLEIQKTFSNWRTPLAALKKKELIESYSKDRMNPCKRPDSIAIIRLNSEQENAVKTITNKINSYQTYLLNGITGSGKTEVYIHCILEILKQGKQALVLVPEIGLTPQFTERFKQQLNSDIAVLHSALTDRERLNVWLACREGDVRIIIGTRSAIWTPFKELGIIIVDEEHDISYKQQEGFRYSARDLALIRAKQKKIPVVLGTATPSLESVYNVINNRYREIKLVQRTSNATLPAINIIDIRGCRMDGAISNSLLEKIKEHLDKKQQVLLFLNRRGYAPVIMCHDCGWICKCQRCDIQMTYHKHIDRLCCHHCQHSEKPVHKCGVCNSSNVIEIGHGTQRLSETLEKNFPGAKVSRIDRDSTRRKGSLQSMFDDIKKGNIDIIVGTQMLAKGHHFPDLTLVGIIDADRGLYSADFRASERLAQIIMQVSGRAGRSVVVGEVILQTHFPNHPLIKSLTCHDYSKIVQIIMKEREQTELPPFSYQVLLRSEANQQKHACQFLADANNTLTETKNIEVFGPYPAPIAKRAGRYRMQLLLQSKNRNHLRRQLNDWVPSLERLQSGHKVRWSVEVDPQDLL